MHSTAQHSTAQHKPETAQRPGGCLNLTLLQPRTWSGLGRSWQPKGNNSSPEPPAQTGGHIGASGRLPCSTTGITVQGIHLCMAVPIAYRRVSGANPSAASPCILHT
jgi:hypothetical protein